MEGVFGSALDLEQRDFCVHSGQEARGKGRRSCDGVLPLSLLAVGLEQVTSVRGAQGLSESLSRSNGLRAPRQVACPQPITHPFHRCRLSVSRAGY